PRGKLRRGIARISPLHPPAELAGPRRAGGAPLGASRGDPALAPGAGGDRDAAAPRGFVGTLSRPAWPVGCIESGGSANEHYADAGAGGDPEAPRQSSRAGL